VLLIQGRRHKLHNVVLEVLLLVLIICGHFQNDKIVDRVRKGLDIVCASWYFKSLAMLTLKSLFSLLVDLPYFRLLRLSPLVERSFFLNLGSMISGTTVFLANLTET
jgi:hypothetical protein